MDLYFVANKFSDPHDVHPLAVSWECRPIGGIGGSSGKMGVKGMSCFKALKSTRLKS